MDYEYLPLDPAKQQLRLLLLDTTVPPESALHFRVQHASLLESDLPPYNAISYRWGQVSELTTVYLDNQPIQVPTTAAAALRGAHNAAPPIEEGGNTLYWIDVVCIHQDNLDEKSSQVALMGEIYRKAGRTLVWLGSVNECNPSLVFCDIDRITAYIGGATQDFAALDKHLWISHHEDLRRFRSSDLAMPLSLDWRSIYRLFATQWFRRLWCVQEVALAKAALCCWANTSLDFEKVCLVARWLVSTANWPRSMACHDTEQNGSKGIDNAACMWDQWKGRLAPKLDMLLYTTYWFETSDHLDKVYGLLGIWQSRAGLQIAELPEHIALLKPDYRKTAAQVFAQASRAVTMVSGNLIVLDVTDSGRTDVGDSDIPSWAPRLDLGYSAQHSPNIFWTQSIGACDGIPTEIAHDTAWNVLRVHGSIVDPIAATHEILDHDTLDATKNVQSFTDLFQWIAYQLGDMAMSAIEEVLVDVLTAGSMTRDEVTKSKKALFSILYSYLSSENDSANHLGEDSKPVWDRRMDEPSIRLFIDTLASRCRSRIVFSTKSRYIGIANRNTRPGDIVCILFGSKKPIILRQFGDGWQFVAVAYVNSLMNGEYIRHLREQRSLSRITQWFNIR